MQLNYPVPRSRRRIGDVYRYQVTDAARGRWYTLLQEVGVPAEMLTGKIVRCPACGGPFRFNDAQGRGTFSCHPSGRYVGVGGDGFMLIGHLFDLRYKQAMRMVGEALGLLEIPTKPNTWRGTA
jgi:putative DNA primase/helicase